MRTPYLLLAGLLLANTGHANTERFNQANFADSVTVQTVTKYCNSVVAICWSIFLSTSTAPHFTHQQTANYPRY